MHTGEPGDQSPGHSVLLALLLVGSQKKASEHAAHSITVSNCCAVPCQTFLIFSSTTGVTGNRDGLSAALGA